MSLIGEAFVKIRPDTTGFQAETTKQVKRDLVGVQRQAAASNREVTNLGRGALYGSGALKGLGRAAASASAAFLGGAGIIYGIKQASAAASNLNEQTSKSSVVFGQSQDAIVEWAKTSATALGLAQDQAIQAAAGFGALLRPLGETEEAAAANSQRLTQLAADLASFSNTSVADALQALSSGLVGEIEPLRRYGVVLSEAAVQQKALVQTGKDSVSQLTAQEKVAARLGIIFDSTGQAQGDFARTSDSLANQQRTLQANLRDLAATIGKGLNPAILDLTSNLNKWFGNTENQQKIQHIANKTADAGKDAVTGLSIALNIANHTIVPITKGTIELDKALYKTGKTAVTTAAEMLNLSLLKPPDPGWAGFFNAVNSLGNIGNVANKLAAVDAGLNPVGPLPPLVPTTVKGQGFVGRPLNPAEQLDIFLAGHPDDTTALKAKRDQYQKALDYALSQVSQEKGNTKQWAKDIETLTGEIQGTTEHLATIAADRAQKAADARQKIIDANKEAAAKRLEAANALTGIPTRLDIQGQIVAANSTSDVQQIPILQREAAAVQKNLATLRKTGQYKTQQLQAELTIATINKQIRDIRAQAAQTAIDAAKQAQADADEAAQKARDAAQARFDALVAETEAEKVASLQVQIQEQRSKNETDLLGPLNIEQHAAEEHLKVLQRIGASAEDQYQEILHIETVKRKIRDIQGQSSGASSAQALFSEAGKALGTYGSNVGAFDLSVQDAGGAAIRAAMSGSGTTPVAESHDPAWYAAHGWIPAPGPGGGYIRRPGTPGGGPAVRDAQNLASALRRIQSSTRSLQSSGADPAVVARAFAQYPGLAKYRNLFRFKISPPSPLGYGSESYGLGERDSFDPRHRAVELFGSKNLPKDVAGELTSHFLARGIDPDLSRLYNQFAKTLTKQQIDWLHRDFERGDPGADFADYVKRAGIPALFRGELFNQLDSGDVTYTPAQEKLFDKVRSIITGSAAGGKRVMVQQNFYGEKNASQALNEASNAARALRY